MGFLSKKKSSPSLPSGSSPSSSSSRPPPLPTSKSFSPSSSRPSDSRYTPSPSLSSLAAQDHGGGLDAPLKIHERFASRSSSFTDDFGSRSNTPTTDFSRGVADPRMGGGSLRGGGAGIGRDEEAALLAARKRRMASEGAEGGGSMRSGRSNHGEPGGGAEHLRGRFKSEASPVDPDVKVIQIRKRRATESKGSTEETTSPSPSPSTSRTRPVLKSTTGSSSSSAYVLPVSIPRPPTPPPPSPEKITFSRSNSSNPPPLDRSISSPANPRDSVITFNSSSSSKHILHSSAYRTTSPPPLPQTSYPHSPAPESTSDAWKAAHDIVLRRGNSAYSSSSTTPPFSPPLAPVHNPPLSSPSSLDPLLSSAGPVRRKKWDPLAAFGGGGGTSPGSTSSPSTGLALQEMEASKGSASTEGASTTTRDATNGRAGDQWSPPRRDAPSAPSSEASRRAEASSVPLISKSRSPSSSGGSYEPYEPWSRSQEDHSSSQRMGTVLASSAQQLPPRQLPSMPVAVPAAPTPPPPPQQNSFSTYPTPPPPPHSILKKKSRSDSSSTQSSLPDVLPPPPSLHPRELTSRIASPTPPPNSISAIKSSPAYPTSPPESESTSFEARASRSGAGSGIIPSPISIPASKTKEKFVALNSPIAPYLQPVSKEPAVLESQGRTTREAKRMAASPPSATPAGFGGREDGGDGLARSEEKTGQKILRRMGSFGFGRGGVDGGDATLISSVGKPPGSPTTSAPKIQPVTPFFRGSDASETPPLSYFSTFSPTSTPPSGQPSSLPSQEEKVDPFEKGEQTFAPRSPTTKSPKSKNVTVSLLRSSGKDVEPKGPNSSRVLQPTAELASSSNRSTSLAPSPNGLPRSPRPSPKPSPSSSPKLSSSELPAPPSPRTSPSIARPLPPQAPLPSSAMLPKTPLELQSVQGESLPKNVVVRPLPQPTPPAPAATTHALRPLPEPARQPLPPLKTNFGGGGLIGARRNFFEQAGATKTSTSSVARQEKETPRRDSALMPNSPPLTPQATPIFDQVSSPSSSVGSPTPGAASSSNHILQSLPVRALPGQSPPPPPPSSIVAAAPPPNQRGYESLLLPDTRPEPSSSDHGSDYNHHWSASSANSSSTTVESSTPPSSVSTPVPIPRATPTALRGTPPSSVLPSSVPSTPSTSYSPPSADFSPHLPVVLDSSSPVPQDQTKPSYPLVHHIGNKVLFETLLRSLSFETWLNLYSTTRAIRRLISLDRDLREVVMERFLGSVGYQKLEAEIWGPEMLALTPNDLNAYLRCVSIPVHEFANSSQAVLSGEDRDPSTVPLLSALNRHYSRVVARIKLQAAAQVLSVHKARKRSSAFASSGAASIRGSSAASIRSLSINKTGVNFSSPLYRLNHALLVRVFVPSPEGPWLSDASVVACENELKTAGIFSALKPGDCVWNTAINEEGNAGYLLFDGYYLVDLDFQFSVMGEIPSFIDAFKFPPSYWHKVVKAAGNPLLYLDLSGPMGVEIKRNTKLILDKAPLAAPDGRERLVQSWIHRSQLVLRETKGMIHADWAGMLVILTQGTNEAVADLARRLDRPGKTPFRLLRERSRPGEIWIRPVLQEESLLARG